MLHHISRRFMLVSMKALRLSLVFFLSFVTLQTLSAHQYEYYRSRQSSSKSEIEDTQGQVCQEDTDQDVILPKVKGVVISGDAVPEHIRKTTIDEVQIYRVMGGIDAKEKEKLKNEIWRMVCNQPLTKGLLKRIKYKVRGFFTRHGQMSVIVRVPPQEVTDGIIVIHVTEARIGEITVTGDRWFKKDRYMEYLRLSEDEVLNNAMMRQDLSAINNNPFRKADIIYKPGKTAGTTDVDINIQDEKPIQFYAGADNTGFKETDYSRLFAGFNWGNAFDYDQILAFQYTAAPDFKKYQSFNIHYTAPLPNRDYIVAFGGYSHIQTSNALLPANVHKGQSWQLSGRYVWPLMPQGLWQQDARVGLDYKRTNNDLNVGDTSITSSLASVFQIAGAYEANYTNQNHVFEGSAEGYLQPWNVGDSMSKAAYNKLRTNADNHYFYAKFGGKYTYNWVEQKMSVMARLRMQFASNTLIPLEQFGLGGYNSVRGYVEREINVDDALLFNFEVKSPSISLSKKMNGRIKLDDALYAVGFLDMGGGWLLSTSVENQPKSYFLAGIGPGVRYYIIPWLQIRLDYGFRLTEVPFGSTYDSIGRFYFSVMGSY